MRRKKKITQTGCTFIVLVIILIIAGEVLSQVQYEGLRRAKKNTLGGYDFYSVTGKKTGFSRATRANGYIFYDSQGNKVGSLKRSDKSKKIYIFYDGDGIKRGILRKGASGIYYYKDIESGKLVDSIPRVKGELGSLSPDIFRGMD